MDRVIDEEDVDEFLEWPETDNLIFRFALTRFPNDRDENRWKKVATLLPKWSPEELAQHYKALIRYEKHLDQLEEEFIREWNVEQDDLASMEQQNVVACADTAMMQQNVNVCPDPAMMQQSHDEDLWKIKKLLQDNDLNKRLLVTMNMAKKFLLPVLDTTHDMIEKGIVVAIWDVDTRTQHSLLLQKWSKSYVLTGDWNRDFVKRRSLKRHDMVGLYWDPSNNRFNFSVLPPEEYIG